MKKHTFFFVCCLLSLFAVITGCTQGITDHDNPSTFPRLEVSPYSSFESDADLPSAEPGASPSTPLSEPGDNPSAPPAGPGGSPPTPPAGTNPTSPTDQGTSEGEYTSPTDVAV